MQPHLASACLVFIKHCLLSRLCLHDTDASGSATFNRQNSLQVYGYQSIKKGQSSEQLLGKFAKQAPEKPQPLVLGTKFFTVPWTNVLVGGGFRLGRQSMIKALKASLQRMDRQQIDLWQVGPLQAVADTHMNVQNACLLHRMQVLFAVVTGREQAPHALASRTTQLSKGLPQSGCLIAHDYAGKHNCLST